ncbi:TPA_asm: hypothetical protein GND82_002897 [Salmonella enterica subsp. salamae serovar 60:g,m,t:z6]|uniref:Uncharacterized protein n=1 Tax=Salmonella enterica subsp. houtenae serovar 1,40:z4,z32:- TaxID=1967604 RepID=A0A730ZJY5_SALHO|nr:hypothetical protein [Salmonella enterica]HAC6701246.1 hypothetical protein [Salmonella bongori serovar 66:z65:-]HAE2268185.1 hypothetical protein [Salmonella enterica subsp. enterica serovar 1,9,12:-:-]HAE4191532.1 hypothetical protein [Salmonella enterica subsp. houtenae serovar 1,40:z4,z32:-]HAE7514025.1 hypothetical protein [Salmonella enterica subsp. salamae serovar 60:g,m,t:z6]
MAIITSPLSATEVHKAKPAANPYYLFDGRGLCLQIKPNPPRVSALTGEEFFQTGIFPRYPFSIAPEIIQLFPEKTFINSHN